MQSTTIYSPVKLGTYDGVLKSALFEVSKFSARGPALGACSEAHLHIQYRNPFDVCHPRIAQYRELAVCGCGGLSYFDD